VLLGEPVKVETPYHHSAIIQIQHCTCYSYFEPKKENQMRYRTPGAIRARRFYRRHRIPKESIGCNWCGELFTPRRSTARFCCDVCRSHHWQNAQFIKWNLPAEWYRYYPANRNRRDMLMYMRGRLLELRGNDWEFIHPAHIREEIRLSNINVPFQSRLV
jgi:hypothetical protein